MSTAPATPNTHAGARLLIAGDLDRLAPLVRDCFAPMPIDGVIDYLSAIAEIPRAETAAVLIGVDTSCRQIAKAVAAIRQVAGAARVVLCCEPAYESWGQQAVAAGADDYVIYPPSHGELEKALGLPSGETRREWMQPRKTSTAPCGDELVQLNALIAAMDEPIASMAQRMAEIIRTAVAAEFVQVLVDGHVGTSRCGDTGADVATDDPVLVEQITGDSGAMGQIRIGSPTLRAYNFDDIQKIRQYAVLFASTLTAALRARRWRTLAYRDELTGLGNRRRLMDALPGILKRAEQERSQATVLIFDIDDLKRYNDRYGHPAGDDIIRETANLFRRCCRQQDLVCRLGGDEFVVVFWENQEPRVAGSTHPRDVIEVFRRFRKALDTMVFEKLGPDACGCLTISAGMATFPWECRTADELLKSADDALLAAKSGGKNRLLLVGGESVCPDKDGN